MDKQTHVQKQSDEFNNEHAAKLERMILDDQEKLKEIYEQIGKLDYYTRDAIKGTDRSLRDFVSQETEKLQKLILFDDEELATILDNENTQIGPIMPLTK